MSELEFACIDAGVERYAATPTLDLRLRITETSGDPIHNIVLHCQLRIHPRRRHHSETEARRLYEIYGDTGDWGRSMNDLQLANVTLVVPPFRASTETDLPVPFTYDLDVAAAKYLHGLEDGEIPLTVLFTGTVFRKAPQGFTVDQIPWDREAAFRLPVRVWREMMDHYFPGGGWLRLHRETIDAVQAFKTRNALLTWDAAIARLLDEAGEVHSGF